MEGAQSAGGPVALSRKANDNEPALPVRESQEPCKSPGLFSLIESSFRLNDWSQNNRLAYTAMVF